MLFKNFVRNMFFFLRNNFGDLYSKKGLVSVELGTFF